MEKNKDKKVKPEKRGLRWGVLFGRGIVSVRALIATAHPFSFLNCMFVPSKDLNNHVAKPNLMGQLNINKNGVHSAFFKVSILFCWSTPTLPKGSHTKLGTCASDPLRNVTTWWFRFCRGELHKIVALRHYPVLLRSSLWIPQKWGLHSPFYTSRIRDFVHFSTDRR